MSVYDVIRRRSRTIAVERRQNITVVDGFPIEGAPSSFNIQGHIQQAQQKDLRNLPEGQRTQDWRVLWSDTELIEADRVTDGGIEYTVQSTEDWNEYGGFHKGLMTEIDELIP